MQPRGLPDDPVEAWFSCRGQVAPRTQDRVKQFFFNFLLADLAPGPDFPEKPKPFRGAFGHAQAYRHGFPELTVGEPGRPAVRKTALAWPFAWAQVRWSSLRRCSACRSVLLLQLKQFEKGFQRRITAIVP